MAGIVAERLMAALEKGASSACRSQSDTTGMSPRAWLDERA
jgi:hypothetical protein